MSPRPRRLSAQDLCQALGRFGFEVVAVRGSHAKLRRVTPDGRKQTLTVPLHREMAPVTLRAVFSQAGRFVPDEHLRPLFFREE